MDMVYENWMELPILTAMSNFSTPKIFLNSNNLIQISFDTKKYLSFSLFLYLLINAILPREAFDPRLISVDMSDRVTHWLLVIKDQMVTLLGCPWIFHHNLMND